MMNCCGLEMKEVPDQCQISPNLLKCEARICLKCGFFASYKEEMLDEEILETYKDMLED